MEGIFSLPYSEYEAIVQFQKLFRKTDGYAVFLPTSRQQKGIDFIVLNTANSKILRVQVKASRSYLHDVSRKNPKKDDFIYNFWFNNFLTRYTRNAADVYLLFGLYPVYDIRNNIKSKKTFWRSTILAFTDREMYRLLQSVKTKKERKPDRFFSISFNDPKRVVGTRGLPHKPDLTGHLLSNKIDDLVAKLD